MRGVFDPATHGDQDMATTDTGDYEKVDHPKHYNQHPAQIECIEVIEPMSFNIGTAIKHMWRAGLKPDNDALTDLRKAAWYLNREIERLSNQ